jgi:predicted DNA-binding protein
MKEDKKLVNVRMSESLAEDLKEISEELEIGQSQFVRDAIRDKIAAVRQQRQSAELAVARA